MYHDKKKVYDFFKYYFNKIFRSLLENNGRKPLFILLIIKM